MREEDKFQDLIEVFEPGTLVEVGSWYGGSALAFLHHASQADIDMRLIAIDTWLGSLEHWMDTIPGPEWSRRALQIVDGEPRFFSSFQENIETAGFSERVEVIRAPSDIGLKYLGSIKRPVDVVYVDGDHRFSGVREDIRLSFSLGGDKDTVVSGDDWGWKDVKRAVVLQSLLSTQGIWVKANMWILLRRDDLRGSELSLRGWKRISVLSSIGSLLLPELTFIRLKKTMRRISRRARVKR